MGDELLRVSQAARLMGVAVSTVRRWTNATPPLLPCVRTAGGHRRIRLADIQDHCTPAAPRGA